MLADRRPARPVVLCLPLVALCLWVAAAPAQTSDETFISGIAGQAWQAWQQALSLLIERDANGAEAAFGQLLDYNPSPMRLALFADRSTQRGNLAGGVLLLQQDAQSGALEEHGKAVAEMLDVGREQLNEADDGWYFASIGQFPIAKANFEALLAQKPDPVALLEFADRDARRHLILVQLSDDEIMGPVVREMLKTLHRGEQLLKADPVRIKQNIARLGGPPRAFAEASANLVESGEYAIPFLLQTLGDSDQRALAAPILRVLPQVGRAGLNPLVYALRIEDRAVRLYVIRALGQIGYAQAVPYLLALREDDKTDAETRSAVEAALSELASRGAFPTPQATAAQAFHALARAYYDDTPSLAADATLDHANVWYYREGLLEPVEVPTPIFNEVMAMRCCEEALLRNADLKGALALWIAADFRRVAQLPAGATDASRPANDPPPLYYAQSAGAKYCQLALAKAVDDHDAVVALGTIAALRNTAGTASLLDAGAGRQPLAEALSFPDRMVRIQAALALGAAKPSEAFQNSQNLLPVLGETLLLANGSRSALVVDADQEAAGAMAAKLRRLGIEPISTGSLYSGLSQIRDTGDGVDTIVIASDSKDPDPAEAVAQIRKEFRFGNTPILIAVKPGDRDASESLARHDPGVGLVTSAMAPEELEAVLGSVSKAVGAVPITPEMGRELALAATDVLRGLAASHNAVFNPDTIEPALLTAFDTKDAELRTKIAGVLAYLDSDKAQRAIAAVALDADQADELRVAMFEALALSGKNNGNKLSADQVRMLLEQVQSSAKPALQAAASQAMGALNLSGNPASELIRKQYQG